MKKARVRSRVDKTWGEAPHAPPLAASLIYDLSIFFFKKPLANMRHDAPRLTSTTAVGRKARRLNQPAG
jgi:hypothetical protein